MQSPLDAAVSSADTNKSGGRRALTAAEQQMLEYVEQSKAGPITVDSAVLLPIYEQLEPVSIEFMLSTWHGSLFNGQTGDGWFGKNMISADHVQPLLFRREDGSVYSNEVWGLAKLTEGEIYGLSKTAKLVYNDKPLHDYFRRVTDDTVIGLTPGELVGGPDFFFQLSRENSSKVVP